MPRIVVTRDVSQLEISALKLLMSLKSPFIAVTPGKHQSAMAPCFAMAAFSFTLYSTAAALRESLLVKQAGGLRGSGLGEGGGGLGEGGGGLGDRGFGGGGLGESGLGGGGKGVGEGGGSKSEAGQQAALQFAENFLFFFRHNFAQSFLFCFFPVHLLLTHFLSFLVHVFSSLSSAQSFRDGAGAVPRAWPSPISGSIFAG